jgi:CheY-like chemotaxis protein
MAVISDDATLCAAMHDALADSHDVTLVPPTTPMTRLASMRPDMLAVGPVAPSMSGHPGVVWDIVARARQHPELRAVPILVLTADLDGALATSGLLSAHQQVHVIGLPFDLDTLTSVLASMERDRLSAARTDRVPDVCSHGFELTAHGPAGCVVCSWSAAHGAG